jgi:type VI protein secretion system component Hcp
MLLALFGLAEETLAVGDSEEVEGFSAPSDFTFTKQVDIASPSIFQAALSGDDPKESVTLNFGGITFAYKGQQ